MKDEINLTDLLKLKNELDNGFKIKFSQIIEDENGAIHCCDKNGNTVLLMSKQELNSVLNWKIDK